MLVLVEHFYSRLLTEDLDFGQQSFVLKALLHFLQREQEMRVGELGPRGAINMGGTGMTV